MTSQTLTASPASAPMPDAVVYPVSDGEPMAETNLHWAATVYAKNALERVLSERRPDVYVSSDNFLYWTKGNPKDCISPDVYVVYGVTGGKRDIFKTWEEGDTTPAFVLELTSRSTRRVDMGDKFDTYESVLRVPEYFLFDPQRHYLAARLSGFRLAGLEYLNIEPDTQGRLYSEQTNVFFYVEGSQLRIYDPEKDVILPDYDEAYDRAEREAQRAEREAQRAEREAQARLIAETRAGHAEAESERLRVELAALRSQSKSDGNS